MQPVVTPETSTARHPPAREVALTATALSALFHERGAEDTLLIGTREWRAQVGTVLNISERYLDAHRGIAVRLAKEALAWAAIEPDFENACKFLRGFLVLKISHSPNQDLEKIAETMQVEPHTLAKAIWRFERFAKTETPVLSTAQWHSIMEPSWSNRHHSMTSSFHLDSPKTKLLQDQRVKNERLRAADLSARVADCFGGILEAATAPLRNYDKAFHKGEAAIFELNRYRISKCGLSDEAKDVLTYFGLVPKDDPTIEERILFSRQAIRAISDAQAGLTSWEVSFRENLRYAQWLLQQAGELESLTKEDKKYCRDIDEQLLRYVRVALQCPHGGMHVLLMNETDSFVEQFQEYQSFLANALSPASVHRQLAKLRVDALVAIALPDEESHRVFRSGRTEKHDGFTAAAYKACQSECELLVAGIMELRDLQRSAAESFEAEIEIPPSLKYTLTTTRQTLAYFPKDLVRDTLFQELKSHLPSWRSILQTTSLILDSFPKQAQSFTLPEVPNRPGFIGATLINRNQKAVRRLSSPEVLNELQDYIRRVRPELPMDSEASEHFVAVCIERLYVLSVLPGEFRHSGSAKVKQAYLLTCPVEEFEEFCLIHSSNADLPSKEVPPEVKSAIMALPKVDRVKLPLIHATSNDPKTEVGAVLSLVNYFRGSKSGAATRWRKAFVETYGEEKNPIETPVHLLHFLADYYRTALDAVFSSYLEKYRSEFVNAMGALHHGDRKDRLVFATYFELVRALNPEVMQEIVEKYNLDAGDMGGVRPNPLRSEFDKKFPDPVRSFRQLRGVENQHDQSIRWNSPGFLPIGSGPHPEEIQREIVDRIRKISVVEIPENAHLVHGTPIRQPVRFENRSRTGYYVMAWVQWNDPALNITYEVRVHTNHGHGTFPPVLETTRTFQRDGKPLTQSLVMKNIDLARHLQGSGADQYVETDLSGHQWINREIREAIVLNPTGRSSWEVVILDCTHAYFWW